LTVDEHSDHDAQSDSSDDYLLLEADDDADNEEDQSFFSSLAALQSWSMFNRAKQSRLTPEKSTPRTPSPAR
jgi:hypothetical protein